LPYPLLEKEKAVSVLQIIMDNHQGTVWAWLLGPFLTALVRVKGSDGKSEAYKLLEDLKPHFEDAGIGTVSEIFDADEPHNTRGCIAQAWSVAEVLRVYTEDLQL
jgi:glycogen debranching enzyme